MKQVLKIKVLFFLCSILVFNHTNAQHLKRKAFLGVLMETLTDSLATQRSLDNIPGVYITSVIENSTFSKLGVKEGSILTKLNDKSIVNIQDVLDLTSQLYEGDTIMVEFFLNKIKQSKATTLMGRPKEKFKNGNVIYGEVVYKDNVLRTILVSPKNTNKSPVIYFLQGYTCGSVETVSDDNPMKKLFNDWLNAGFAIYRIEKPGVGDSKSKKHCYQINFDEELKAFNEGYKNLIQQENIDANNIFMFGHSMGGVIAPLLNEIQSPQGIMVYGTVGKNWYDYMVDLYTIQPKHFGVSDSEIKEDSKINLSFNKDLLINKLSGPEILKNKTYAEFFSANESNLRQNQYIGRHFKFWQNLADINIPKTWSNVKTNVLAMHGEFDIQAINPKGAKKIAEIVTENGGNGDFMLIKKADHGFVNFNSMRQNVQTLGNGTYMNHARNNYSSELGIESINWIKSKIKK
jgi:dienelactone hydrolase